MRRLSRRLVVLAACVAWSATGVVAADAAEVGSITGAVWNRTTGRPQAGAAVRLVGGRKAGGGGITRRAVTDSRGRFKFSGLPTGGDRFYALDVLYERGLFAGGVVSLPANTTSPPVVDAEVSVWETTTDPGSIVVARDALFVVPSRGGVGVVESVRIAITGERAYIGRAPSRPGAAATLAFALPPSADASGVRIVDATLDIPRIRPSDLGFVTTVAIPPGRTEVNFTYPLRGSTGQFDLTRRALYPLLEYLIHAAEPLTVQGGRLQPGGEVEVGGRTYTRYTTSEPLEAGDVVEALAVAEAGWDPRLVGSLAAAGTGMAAAAAFAIARRRSSATAREAVAPTPRDELITAIADLDIRHQAGEIDEEPWARKRAELKARLAELGEPQPAP